MIICEIGINHLGSELRATKMVNQILKTNIDALTFQIPSPDFIKSFKKKLLKKFTKMVKRLVLL